MPPSNTTMTDAILDDPLAIASAHQWHIAPQSMFSRHFDLALRGEMVATLHMSLWSEGCQFTIAGYEFTIRKASLWKDGFLLVTAGQTVCEVRRSFWSRQFEFVAGDQQWVLRPAGWFTRVYHLLADERVMGSVLPTGWFTRARVADFRDEVPLPVQVLAIFLVLVVSQRQARRSN